MNIVELIDLLDDIGVSIIDFADVKMKTGNSGVRVTLDRLLTDDEKRRIQSNHIVGLDCVTYYRYDPRIRYSYFYVV